MKALEVKTRVKYRQPQYKQNLNSVTTFLRHSEDRITVVNKEESVEIEIYKNGTLVFIGDKYELYEKLSK